MALQDSFGNRAVDAMLKPSIPPLGAAAGTVEREERTPPEQSAEKEGEEAVKPALAAPETRVRGRFRNQGRVGTARFGSERVSSGDERPHLFTNGGRTGDVVFAGGGGAGPHGNEAVGSLQSSVAPAYESRSLGPLSNSEAWVRAGTGNIDVTRSWTGSNAGDQGNGYYLTAAAAARADLHERRHVLNSQGHYNTHIQPLLNRIKDYTPAPAGGGKVETSFFQIVAQIAVASVIQWSQSIAKFVTADTADNTPLGTVDQAYYASGTDLVDAGPGTVGGTAFQHRVHVRTEQAPT